MKNVKNWIGFNCSKMTDRNADAVRDGTEFEFALNAKEPLAGAQTLRVGWTPPFAGDDRLFVCIGADVWAACYSIESKTVPAAVLRAEVDRLKLLLKTETNISKKESAELKQVAFENMILRAFSTTKTMLVLFIPSRRLIFVGTNNLAHASQAVSMLGRSFADPLGASLVRYGVKGITLASSMAWRMVNGWLNSGSPIAFGREFHVTYTEDGDPASVKLKGVDVLELSPFVELEEFTVKKAALCCSAASFTMDDFSRIGNLTSAGNDAMTETDQAALWIITEHLLDVHYEMIAEFGDQS